jgi:hypothetical protein
MSDTVITQTKPKTATQGRPADKDALAQVEKWMEIIREVTREQAKN